jgi:hypothetical protein
MRGEVRNLTAPTLYLHTEQKAREVFFLLGILREIPDTCGNIKKMSRLAGTADIGVAMPAKKESVTEAERAKRIRDAARDHETSNDPAVFERALAAVARGAKKPKKRIAEKK